MRALWPVAGLLVIASLAPAAEEKANDATPIHRALQRLYNFDFAGTHVILNRYVSEQPDDPLGYAFRASAYLFSELDRLSILEAEFLTDDDRITEKKKGQPDPAVRQAMMDALSQARRHAQARLKSNPRDADALFTMCVVSGVETDYAALVEKRQFGSLSYAKQSQKYAVRLLAENPNYYDAYLTAGVSEYLLGSMPFFLRWFVHFDRVEGNKKKAIDNLKLVARSGFYLKPFAKILLSIIYLREKQPKQSEQMLTEFAHEYPENPLVQRELARFKQKR